MFHNRSVPTIYWTAIWATCNNKVALFPVKLASVYSVLCELIPGATSRDCVGFWDYCKDKRLWSGDMKVTMGNLRTVRKLSRIVCSAAMILYILSLPLVWLTGPPGHATDGTSYYLVPGFTTYTFCRLFCLMEHRAALIRISWWIRRSTTAGEKRTRVMCDCGRGRIGGLSSG